MLIKKSTLGLFSVFISFEIHNDTERLFKEKQENNSSY